MRSKPTLCVTTMCKTKPRHSRKAAKDTCLKYRPEFWLSRAEASIASITNCLVSIRTLPLSSGVDALIMLSNFLIAGRSAGGPPRFPGAHESEFCQRVAGRCRYSHRAASSFCLTKKKRKKFQLSLFLWKTHSKFKKKSPWDHF